MRFLADLGWQVQGLEWDAGAAEVARRVTGRPVHVGDVHGFRPEHAFDAILLNHSSSTCPIRWPTWRGWASCSLRAVGWCWCGRNPRGLGARRFGAAWFAWDPPRHLVIPTASAVGAAARRVGLGVRSWRTLGRGAASHAAYSRAIAAHRPVTLDHPDIGAADRAFPSVDSCCCRWRAASAKKP
jgi:hypothetical protein